MSLARLAKRKDTAQAEIVEGLRKMGYGVWILDVPCDLLVHHPSWGTFMRTLEVKNPGAKPRKEQAKQRAFLELTGTPIVTSLADAIAALRVTA